MSNTPHTPSIYGSGDLSYNDYLKIPELLSLQKPLSQPEHHDELLFIIIHQAYELWFKLILSEMENAISTMSEKKVLRAHHFLKRANAVFSLLVRQIHILETMTPAEFLKFRDKLNPASGFQSMQFREIEFLSGLKDERYLAHFKNRPELVAILKKRMEGPDLRMAYYDLLSKLGYSMPSAPFSDENPSARAKILDVLKSIYQEPEKELPIYLLSEDLVDLDQNLALWREHHVKVVERVIGFKRGTGGSSGVEYLRSTVSKKSFPLLWEVRTHLV